VINTGYQRELTYQRADGLFSAFGDSDMAGSIWLACLLSIFENYVAKWSFPFSLSIILSNENSQYTGEHGLSRVG